MPYCGFSKTLDLMRRKRGPIMTNKRTRMSCAAAAAVVIVAVGSVVC